MEQVPNPWYQVTPGPYGPNGTQTYPAISSNELWGLVKAAMYKSTWGELYNGANVNGSAIKMIKRVKDIVDDSVKILEMIAQTRGIAPSTCIKAIYERVKSDQTASKNPALYLMLFSLNVAKLILEVKELKRQMNEHERPNNYSKTPNNWSVIPYTPQRRNQYSYHPLTPHGIVDKLLKIYSRDDIVYSAIPANQPIAPPPYNPGYIDPNTDLNTDLDSYHLQKASQQALRVKRMTEIHDEMDKLHKELRDLMQGLNMRERN